MVLAVEQSGEGGGGAAQRVEPSPLVPQEGGAGVDVPPQSVGARQVAADRLKILHRVDQHVGSHRRPGPGQRGIARRHSVGGRVVEDRDAAGRHRRHALGDAHGAGAGASAVGPQDRLGPGAAGQRGVHHHVAGSRQHQRRAGVPGHGCGHRDVPRLGAAAARRHHDVGGRQRGGQRAGVQDTVVGVGGEAGQAGIRRVGNRQIVGIEQQRAEAAGAAGQIRRPREGQSRLARHLGIAAAGGAARRNGTGEAGVAVGPHDDAPAPPSGAVGGQARPLRHRDAAGGRNAFRQAAGRRVAAALIVAADQQRTARRTGDVERRLTGQHHGAASRHQRSARATVPPGGVDRRADRHRSAGHADVATRPFWRLPRPARRLRRARAVLRPRIGPLPLRLGPYRFRPLALACPGCCVGSCLNGVIAATFGRHRRLDRHRSAVACRQEDAPVLAGDSCRLDHAAGVAGQRVEMPAIGPHLGVGCVDGAGIDRFGVGAADADGEAPVAVGGFLRQHFIAGQKRCGAVRRSDAALVADGAGDQRHVPAPRGDGPHIDDRRLRLSGEGPVALRGEGGVGDVVGGREEAAAGVDPPFLSDDDAGAVDQIDRSGGRQRAVDARRQRAGHAVQRRAGPIVHMHGFSGPDGEALPFDDSGARGLLDPHRVRPAFDPPGSGGEVPAHRQGFAGHCGRDGRQRGPVQQGQGQPAMPDHPPGGLQTCLGELSLFHRTGPCDDLWQTHPASIAGGDPAAG